MGTLIYTNPHTGERLNDDKARYSYPDFVRFLSGFSRPNISLITTMPSGLGLDFLSHADGTIWIEFYGDEIQSTNVDLAMAGKILERAYTAKPGQSIRQLFSDLVQKWDY
jgi:hypothetical protein